MPIAAAELVARVSTQGVDSASAQLGIMGNAVNAVGGIFKQLGSGASLMGFGLSNMGTAGVKSGLAIRDAAVQMGGALWKIAGIATLVGAAVAVAIGVMAVKAAGDFQQGLNRLRTGAGDTQDSFASLSKGILAVSVATGQVTGPLTNAMYLILSSGQRGAQAFDTLSAAAKGAVIEQASVVDVANVVSGAMHNFGTKTFSATDYMNGLIKAVSLGKITLQQLSVSMGPLEPLAHQLGISYNDLSAAMTTQTNAMIPAARAATSLRFMMQSLEVPTHKANAAMTKWGLDSVAVGEEMKKSLPGALQMIYDAAKKAGPEGSVPFNRAFSDMIGGQRSLSAALALTGSHMKDFVGNSKAIADAMKNGKGDVQGWSIAQGNFNVQMDRAKAAGQALLITIGQQLLPVMTQLFAAIVPIIVGFTQWLTSSGALHNTLVVLGGAFNVLGTIVGGIVHFFQQNEIAGAALKATLILVAAVVGGLLVFALVAATVAAWGFTVALLANPLIWLAIIIIAAITGIILVIQHWGQITAWLGSVWAAFASWFMGLWNGILAWVGGVFSAIGATMRNAVSGVGQAFSNLGSAIRDKLTGIKNTVGDAFSAIGSTIHDKLEGAKTTAGNVFSAIGTFMHDKLEGAKQTAQNFATGVLNSMQWLYNHNYYVKAMVDAMAKDFKWIGDQFSALGSYLRTKQAEIGAGFSQMGANIRNILTAVKNNVGDVFSGIGTIMHDKLTATKTDTGNIFSAIGDRTHQILTGTKNDTGNIFSAIGDRTHQILTGTKNDVGSIMSAIGTTFHNALSGIRDGFGSAFSAIGTTVHNALSGIWSWIVGFVSGWPAQAFRWGANFVQGLINGIGSMFSALGNAVSNLAGQFGKLLGFHSPPPEGPARDSDKWGPAFVTMFAKGLEAGIPQIEAIVGRLAKPISVGLSGAAPGLSPAYARASSTPVTIVVQPPDLILDGVRLSRGLMPHITNAIRYNVSSGFGR